MDFYVEGKRLDRLCELEWVREHFSRLFLCVRVRVRVFTAVDFYVIATCPLRDNNIDYAWNTQLCSSNKNGRNKESEVFTDSIVWKWRG